MTYKRFMTRKALPKRNALVVALAVGLGVSGLAYGQATTGTIFGQAPAANGEVVEITGGAGIDRTVPVSPSGRYTVTLPVGSYTVTLKRNGTVVQSRTGVQPAANGAVEVDFTSTQANAQQLSAVTVSANAIPAIDVGSTTVQTTITAQQLDHLPIARSAEAIALLSPGVTLGASANGYGPTGNPLLSFGGSSVVENAYYVDGMITTDPLANLGGITLPYNTIQQEQVLMAGYGAKYGRSAGGVINQIGKSGTNTWHFGGRILWRPAEWRASPANVHWNNPNLTSGPQAKGKLQRWRNDNHQWTTTYDAYLSGPLIKDKLFFYAAGEFTKTIGNSVGAVTSNNVDYQHVTAPKYYFKLDWNITDRNILSVTGLYNSRHVAGDTYSYNNDNHTSGQFQSADQKTQNEFRVWVANYTSYITNNLTLHAMYGKMDGDYHVSQPLFPGYDPDAPNILNPNQQDPAKTPTGAPGVISGNLFTNIADPRHHSEVINKRLDLDYRIGINDIQFGIDNVTTRDLYGGEIMTGPGYAWSYNHEKLGEPIQGDPAHPAHYVPPPPASAACPTAKSPNQACVVSTYRFVDSTSITVKQQAQYLQDKIQATPRLLVTVGVRRSAFKNLNLKGQPYINEKNNWAPRLGASWDVHGDSSLKIFANFGRYYLALPPGPGLRGAGDALYSKTFYAYDSIDANGIPHGHGTGGPNGDLTPIGHKVYENNSNGELIDPKTVAATNAKAEYQDMFVLGAEQKLADGFVGGITLRYSNLGRILDDWGDQRVMQAQLEQAGLFGTGSDQVSVLPGAVLINPGKTNVVRFTTNGGGYVTLPITAQEMKFAKAKRKYWSVELSLTHPWDGKWFGKATYVLSHSYGNTEGGVQSNIGQAGPGSVDQTEQWDYPELMYYAGGDQANDRRHVFKAFGMYKIAPNWRISGNILLAQGTPVNCLGRYGAAGSDPVGYANVQGGAYHWCGGVPTPPGSTGRTPWQHIVSLGIEYLPSFADHKLKFQLQVHNVFNEQEPIQEGAIFGTNGAGPSYRLPTGSTTHTALTPAQFGYETPRYVQLGIMYNY